MNTTLKSFLEVIYSLAWAQNFQVRGSESDIKWTGILK